MFFLFAVTRIYNVIRDSERDRRERAIYTRDNQSVVTSLSEYISKNKPISSNPLFLNLSQAEAGLHH